MSNDSGSASTSFLQRLMVVTPFVGAAMWALFGAFALFAIPGHTDEAARAAVSHADQVAYQVYSTSGPSVGTPQYGPPDLSNVKRDVRNVAVDSAIALLLAGGGLAIVHGNHRDPEGES